MQQCTDGPIIDFISCIYMYQSLYEKDRQAYLIKTFYHFIKKNNQNILSAHFINKVNSLSCI